MSAATVKGFGVCLCNAPNTREMVAAKIELSNIFLHTSQAVDKKGESTPESEAAGRESLETGGDYEFSSREQAKRSTMVDG